MVSPLLVKYNISFFKQNRDLDRNAQIFYLPITAYLNEKFVEYKNVWAVFSFSEDRNLIRSAWEYHNAGTEPLRGKPIKVPLYLQAPIGQS
jgi:hypothetical protein